MRTFAELKNIFYADGMCGEYSDMLESCQSKKEIFEFACMTEPMLFLVKESSRHPDIVPEYIRKEFSAYINGRFVANKGRMGKKTGYDSCMYCGYTGDITADVSLMCIIDSKVKVNIPEHTALCLVCDNLNPVKIDCPESSVCIVHCPENTKVESLKKSAKIRIIQF